MKLVISAKNWNYHQINSNWKNGLRKFERKNKKVCCKNDKIKIWGGRIKVLKKENGGIEKKKIECVEKDYK
jgi:hypothetical protein